MIVVATVLCSAAFLVFWFGSFWVIAWCQKSHYRYELWRLRDNVIDAIRSDALPDSESVRHLVNTVEVSIREAEKLTLVNLASMFFAMGPRVIDRALSQGFPDYGDMSDGQVTLLNAYRHTFSKATFVYVLSANPIGWALSLFAWVTIKLLVWRERRTNPSPDFSLALASLRAVGTNLDSNQQDQPLSAFAG